MLGKKRRFHIEKFKVGVMFNTLRFRRSKYLTLDGFDVLDTEMTIKKSGLDLVSEM